MHNLVMRTNEQLQIELASISSTLLNQYAVTVEESSLKEMIQELVSEKVEDYLFQRLRDWPIKDLVRLSALIGIEKIQGDLIGLQGASSEASLPKKKVRK